MNDIQNKWNEIVRITKDTDYILQGIRNRLFLRINKKKELRINLISFLFIIKYLIYPIKKIKYLRIDTLFYFPYNTAANFNNLFPIYEKFINNEANVFVISTKKISVKFFNNNQLQTESLFQYVSFKERIISLKYAYNKFIQLLRVNKNNDFNIDLYIFWAIYQIVIFKKFFESFLIKCKCKKVISTSDFFPIDFALFSTANSLNINTYMIQHGVLGISHYPFTSKYLFVWNKFIKNELLMKGAEKKRIIVSGMPSTDLLFNIRNESRIKSKAKYKFLILSDTQGKIIYPNVYRYYKLFLHNLIKLNLNIDIIIKLHPAEDSSFYDDFYEKIQLLDKNTTLVEAIENCDIASTIWSTAGLEAMILCKPTFILEVHKDVRKYAWWPKEGGGRYINEAKDIIKFLNPDELNKILSEQELFIKKYFAHSGKSSEIIYKVMNNDNKLITKKL